MYSKDNFNCKEKKESFLTFKLRELLKNNNTRSEPLLEEAPKQLTFHQHSPREKKTNWR